MQLLKSGVVSIAILTAGLSATANSLTLELDNFRGFANVEAVDEIFGSGISPITIGSFQSDNPLFTLTVSRTGTAPTNGPFDGARATSTGSGNGDYSLSSTVDVGEDLFVNGGKVNSGYEWSGSIRNTSAEAQEAILDFTISGGRLFTATPGEGNPTIEEGTFSPATRFLSQYRLLRPQHLASK